MDISKIKLPDNTELNIKDAVARQSIAELSGAQAASYPNITYTVYSPSATSGAISLDFDNGPVQVITLSGNASSVSTSNITNGHSLHVIFKSSDASTSYTVAIAHDATTSNCPAGSALSLTVPGNSAGYTEVDFLNVNNVIYVRGV